MRVTRNRQFSLSFTLPCQLLVVALVAVSAPRFAQAQNNAPLHYYDAAIGKTGTALKSALHEIIKDHVVIPYTSTATDTWDALKLLDQDPANSNNVVLIYSGLVAPKSEQFNGTSGTWDREHLWPQSYGLVVLNSNSRAKSDLFNLRPINTGVNSSRGNKYYDISTAPVSTYPGAPGSTYDSDSWEPRNPDKGTIARSMFYMAVRYDGSDPDVPDLDLSDSPDPDAYRFGELTALLSWHRQFNVNASERQRNESIYSDYQHNRNPFVDHPDYAEMVFSGVSPGTAWTHTHFTAAEVSNPAISGDSADPDGDGLSNLLEYLFNRDPRQREQSAAMITSTATQNGNRYLLLTFPHNRNATDLALTYESSGDLRTWVSAIPDVVSDIVTTSETEQRTVHFLPVGMHYFVRVRVGRIGP